MSNGRIDIITSLRRLENGMQSLSQQIAGVNATLRETKDEIGWVNSAVLRVEHSVVNLWREWEGSDCGRAAQVAPAADSAPATQAELPLVDAPALPEPALTEPAAPEEKERKYKRNMEPEKAGDPWTDEDYASFAECLFERHMRDPKEIGDIIGRSALSVIYVACNSFHIGTRNGLLAPGKPLIRRNRKPKNNDSDSEGGES